MLASMDNTSETITMDKCEQPSPISVLESLPYQEESPNSDTQERLDSKYQHQGIFWKITPISKSSQFITTWVLNICLQCRWKYSWNTYHAYPLFIKCFRIVRRRGVVTNKVQKLYRVNLWITNYNQCMGGWGTSWKTWRVYLYQRYTCICRFYQAWECNEVCNLDGTQEWPWSDNFHEAGGGLPKIEF